MSGLEEEMAFFLGLGFDCVVLKMFRGNIGRLYFKSMTVEPFGMFVGNKCLKLLPLSRVQSPRVQETFSAPVNPATRVLLKTA